MSSDLYTGTNGGSFGNDLAQEQRDKIKQQTRERKANLTPAINIMTDKIATFKKASEDLTASIVSDTTVPDESMRVEVLAHRKFIALCKSLETELKQIKK